MADLWYDSYVSNARQQIAAARKRMRPEAPDMIRRAAKRLRNQPELWCQGKLHDGERSCALGQIEDVMGGRLAAPHDWTGVMDLANKASTKLTGDLLQTINDDPGATPASVADHLDRVADEIEFGDE